MKKLTVKWLLDNNACESGVIWVKEQNTTDIKELYARAMRQNKYSDINWTLVRLMTKKQKVMYAVFAAELVLHIYEKSKPDDDRPRKAIEAAKDYLKKPCAKAKDAARAAAYAAYSAAYAAYSAARDAAYSAARAAAYAAYSAARAAVYAADEKREAYKTIFEYGLNLIGEGDETI